jgi:lysozyme family protein
MNLNEQARFDRCLAEVLRLEGGYADDPRDRGGPTRFGITLASLGEARGRPVSADDVRRLTPAEAGSIYRTRYWTPMRCADLAEGVDLMAFDAAVNMGTAGAARLLQAALAVKADGVIGPATVEAARRAFAPVLIRQAADLRRARYRSLAGFAAFGAGWLNRVDTVEALALALARPPLAEGRTA